MANRLSGLVLPPLPRNISWTLASLDHFLSVFRVLFNLTIQHFIGFPFSTIFMTRGPWKFSIFCCFARASQPQIFHDISCCRHCSMEIPGFTDRGSPPFRTKYLPQQCGNFAFWPPGVIIILITPRAAHWSKPSFQPSLPAWSFRRGRTKFQWKWGIISTPDS